MDSVEGRERTPQEQAEIERRAATLFRNQQPWDHNMSQYRPIRQGRDEAASIAKRHRPHTYIPDNIQLSTPYHTSERAPDEYAKPMSGGEWFVWQKRSLQRLFVLYQRGRMKKQYEGLSTPVPGDFSAIKLNLKNHQKTGILQILRWRDDPHRKGGALLDEQGLGKSAIIVGSILLGEVPGLPSLLIAPSHLIEHWKDLFKQYLGDQAFKDYRLVVLHDNSKPTATAIQEAQCVLTTYEQIRNHQTAWVQYVKLMEALTLPLQKRWETLEKNKSLVEDEINYGRGEATKHFDEKFEMPSKPFTLIGQRWNMVVADDSHRLRNMDARGTQAYNAVAEISKLRLSVTGTPLQNCYSDIAAMLHSMGEVHYDVSKEASILTIASERPR